MNNTKKKMNVIATVACAALTVVLWGCTNPEPGTAVTDTPSDTDSPKDTDSTDDHFEQGCNGECDAYMSFPYLPTACVCHPENYCRLANDDFCDNRCLSTGVVETMFAETEGVCDLPCQDNPDDDDWVGFDVTNYAPGPYGLKPGTCVFPCGIGSPRVECGYEWVSIGDTFPNLCLPNKDNEDFCMEELYESQEHNLLVVDFGFLGCEPCESLGTHLPGMVERLKSDGYNPYWVTVMIEGANGSGPATDADASAWTQTFEAQYPEEIRAVTEVLYEPDPSQSYRYMNEAWAHDTGNNVKPRFFFVDTATMKILHVHSGWQYKTWDGSVSGPPIEDPPDANYPLISEVLNYARTAIGQ